MCIGLPMQVITGGDGYALCEGLGIQRRVDTLLTGNQPVGTWLLVFLDSAREVLQAEEAQRITHAVQALGQVMQPITGESMSIDALFADLVDREPPKPASLIALEKSRSGKT